MEFEDDMLLISKYPTIESFLNYISIKSV